jgi:hypothetical protein
MDKVCVKCLEYINLDSGTILEIKTQEYYHHKCYMEIVNKKKMICIKKIESDGNNYWKNELDNEKKMAIKTKQKIN